MPFLLVYPLFLIQAGLSPWGPDLLLVTVVAAAMTQDDRHPPASRRLIACGLGALAGLLLDLTTPSAFGLNLSVYSLVGYGTAAIVTVIWRSAWIGLPIIVIACLLRLLAHQALQAPVMIGPFLASTALTLALILPWLALMQRLIRLDRAARPRVS